MRATASATRLLFWCRSRCPGRHGMNAQSRSAHAPAAGTPAHVSPRARRQAAHITGRGSGGSGYWTARLSAELQTRPAALRHPGSVGSTGEPPTHGSVSDPLSPAISPRPTQHVVASSCRHRAGGLAPLGPGGLGCAARTVELPRRLPFEPRPADQHAVPSDTVTSHTQAQRVGHPHASGRVWVWRPHTSYTCRQDPRRSSGGGGGGGGGDGGGGGLRVAGHFWLPFAVLVASSTCHQPAQQQMGLNAVAAETAAPGVRAAG